MIFQHSNYYLFERVHVPWKIFLPFPKIQNGVCNNLSRTVISYVSSPTGITELNPQALELSFIDEKIFSSARFAHGKNWFVFKENQYAIGLPRHNLFKS